MDMKKHLFPDAQRRDQFTSRDALMNVVYRTNRQHVSPAQWATNQDEALRYVKCSREARRLARKLRRCRKTAEKTDVENKENVCYTQHSAQSAATARRRDALPSSAEFYPAVTYSRGPSRRSVQFVKFFGDVPLSGRCRLASRGVDSASPTLTQPADSRTAEIHRPRVLDARPDDTSVWSAVSHHHHDDDRQHPRSTTVDSLCVVSPPELSRISSEDQEELREQTSSGDLTGAFHSTFSYPLHSTLITAAVTTVDLSSVAEADAAGQDLEPSAAAADPAPTSPQRSTSTVSDAAPPDADAVAARKVCPPTSGNFLYNHHVTTAETDHIRTNASSQSGGEQNARPMTLRSSCYGEASGKPGELGKRASSRLMLYFPPLSTTTADASSTSAAKAFNVNVPLEDAAAADAAAANDDVLQTVNVLDTECRRRIRHVDSSLEAVRGSPCGSNHHDPAGLDVVSRLTPSSRRCHVDVRTISRPAHRTTDYRRAGRCVAQCTSKSGGRGTTTSRMARETGRGDLRHTFSGSPPPPRDDRRQSRSLTSREVFRVYRSHHSRAVDNGQCRPTRVHQRPRRSRRSRCRCGTVERQNLVNFVDLRTDTRLPVLLPSESAGNKPAVAKRRSERYLDRVRKRTLVNRLRQFSGCFCDTGCGQPMRTLANV